MLGIAIGAVGIPQDVIDRFKKSLEDAKVSIPYRLEVESGPRPAGDLNRAAFRNRAMRRLLPFCDKIICIDVDMLIPPGLVEWAAEQIGPSRGLLVRCRRTPLFDGTYHWDQWSKGPHFGEGGFIGLSTVDWIRLGGWDERLSGWGSEDTTVLWRSQLLGIKIATVHNWPLVHVEHPKRDPEHPPTIRRNLNTGMTGNWPQCLTGRRVIPELENIAWFWVTSSCQGRCPHCSQQSLMRATPTYHMTLDEVDAALAAIRVSRYRPFSRVCVVGGDGLLWTNLDYGIEKLWRAEIGPVYVFTNGLAFQEAFPRVGKMVTKFWVSVYSWNQRFVRMARRRPRKTLFVDSRKHWPPPTKPLGPEMLPAECVGVGYLFHNYRVYPCCNLPAIGMHQGWKIEDIPSTDLSPGFIERTDEIRKQVGELCQGCIGNRKVQRFLDLCPSRP